MKSFKLCEVKFNLTNILNNSFLYYRPESELFIKCKIDYPSGFEGDYICQVDLIILSKKSISSSLHTDFLLNNGEKFNSNCIYHDKRSMVYELRKLSEEEILKFKKIRLLS